MKKILLFLIALAVSNLSIVQANPLSIPVRMTYPETTKTVADAVEWLLFSTEYKIVRGFQNAEMILGQPAPVQHNNENVVLPLLDAVASIVGEENTIVIDHKHKLITVIRGDS